MPALSEQDYEALNGPLERQNLRYQELETKLERWEKTSPTALKLRDICKTREIAAYYFGGVCRDVWNQKEPRDIDVVIENFHWEQFLKEVQQYKPKTNRFGGLKFKIEGKEVDAWAIGNTWAFTQGQSVPPCASRLPETTLLNIESVVSMVWHPEGKITFDKGFFQAMESKTLEIQTKWISDIAFPALCIARINRHLESGDWKEGHSIKYFRSAHPVSKEEIRAAHKSHYGTDPTPKKG